MLSDERLLEIEQRYGKASVYVPYNCVGPFRELTTEVRRQRQEIEQSRLALNCYMQGLKDVADERDGLLAEVKRLGQRCCICEHRFGYAGNECEMEPEDDSWCPQDHICTNGKFQPRQEAKASCPVTNGDKCEGQWECAVCTYDCRREAEAARELGIASLLFQAGGNDAH
jgi:hypothetical protein